MNQKSRIFTEKWSWKDKADKAMQPLLAFIGKVMALGAFFIWARGSKVHLRIHVMYVNLSQWLPMSVDNFSVRNNVCFTDYYNLVCVTLPHGQMEEAEEQGQNGSLTTARTSSCTHLSFTVEEANLCVLWDISKTFIWGPSSPTLCFPLDDPDQLSVLCVSALFGQSWHA